MKRIDIRARMLLAALLPVTLVALLLAAVFLATWFRDFNEAHEQRTRALARQLATASEYGLFSANLSQLQTIASGALRESDVRTVAILDLNGKMLASAGNPRYRKLPTLSVQEVETFDPVTGLDLLSQPIYASQVKLDDLFEAKAGDATPAPQLLGYVLIEISHELLQRREREMLLVGLAVTLGGLLFGGYLALRLGRGVIHPILRVSDMIERIGRGDLSARVAVFPNDPLHDLQQVLNQMAERLESGRDELEQRIAMATLELREKKEEAETAVLAKSRFLAAASHDLRQPTHALGMFVARLAQLPHDAQTRQLIGSLEASLHALQDLLDGLLDISRLDAQAVQVQVRPFALAEIFEQLGAGLTLTAVEKGLRLRVRPTDVCVVSDPALLHRILLNLLVNALRYTKAGSVLLACRLSGGGTLARIEVWDSGIGIAPEHHQAIFKEFYQVGNTERDRNKGLGLGLNIVERTAHLLGHRLQFRSCQGLGTRFSIDVPLRLPGTTLELPGPPEVSAVDDLSGLIVLVIEDDALAREGLVTLLESWGSVVRVAEGISTALWHLKFGLVPDVIVSDYRLRDGENGMETISRLRAVLGRRIAACLMSGDTDPALMQAAKREGLTLLHKPVRPAKLRSLVRRWAVDVQAEGPDLV
jgi:signal transduction histidine kinase/CheY-like chemotaxis protein